MKQIAVEPLQKLPKIVARVKVEQKTYPSVTQKFFGTATILDQAKATNAQAFKALRAAFRN